MSVDWFRYCRGEVAGGEKGEGAQWLHNGWRWLGVELGCVVVFVGIDIVVDGIVLLFVQWD